MGHRFTPTCWRGSADRRAAESCDAIDLSTGLFILSLSEARTDLHAETKPSIPSSRKLKYRSAARRFHIHHAPGMPRPAFIDHACIPQAALLISGVSILCRRCWWISPSAAAYHGMTFSCRVRCHLLEPPVTRGFCLIIQQMAGRLSMCHRRVCSHALLVCYRVCFSVASHHTYTRFIDAAVKCRRCSRPRHILGATYLNPSNDTDPATRLLTLHHQLACVFDQHDTVQRRSPRTIAL
jgi:hypothetical protein